MLPVKDCTIFKSSIPRRIVQGTNTDNAPVKNYDDDIPVPPNTVTLQVIRIKQEILVSRGLEKLEGESLGVVQSAHDISIRLRDTEKRIAAAIIRPSELKMTIQLNFLFDSRQWRHRRSIHASMLRMTMASKNLVQENAHNVREVSCTCYKYKTSMCCLQKDAVLGNEHNKMSAFSFPIRKPNTVLEHAGGKLRNCLSVPSTDTDNLRLWYVHRRKHSSSLFS